MSSSRNSSITDSDFEDVSSFSSIDSYKPEPFTGNLDNSPAKGQDIDTTLMKNDTIVRHDTRTTTGSNTTNSTHTATTTHELNSRASANTLRKQTSQSVERTVTHNALNDNVETIESLAAKGINGTKEVIPDINTPLTMTKTSEFPEEYNIETDTGLVKMKTIETLRRQTSRVSTQKSTKSKTESTKSEKSASSFKSSMTDSNQGQLTADKLNKAVEKNRKELEKYKKHKDQKGIKGFFSKMF